KTVLHRGGHAVRFVPDDDVANDPATILHSNRESKGNQSEILVFQTRQFFWRDALMTVGHHVHRLTLARPPSRGRVGVAQVDPARPGRLENAVNLIENRA